MVMELEYIQHGSDILSHFMLDVTAVQFNFMIILLALGQVSRVSHELPEFVALLIA